MKKNKIISIFSEFISLYPRDFSILIVLVVIEAAIVAGSVVSIVPFTDYILDRSLSDPSQITVIIVKIFSLNNIAVNFWTLGGFFIGLNFISGLLKVVVHYSTLSIKYKILRGIFSKALKDFFQAKLVFFTDTEHGKIINTLNKEINVIGDALGNIATQFAQIVQLCVYFTLPFWLNFKMTIIALCLALFFFVPFYMFNGLSYKLGVRNTETANMVMRYLGEIMSMVRIIIGYGNQKKVQKGFVDVWDNHVDATLRSQTLVSSIGTLYTPFVLLSIIIAFGFSIEGGAKISETTAILWSLLSSAPVASAFLQTNISINNFIPSYEQLKILKKTANSNKEKNGPYLFKTLEKGLSLKNACLYHNKNTFILKNINIFFKAGTTTALVGQSGGGKSTIVDVILGLQTLNSGEYCVDRHSFENFDKESFRNKIGYVSQDSLLFSKSIRDNLLWANKDASQEDMCRSLKMSNAYDFVMEFTDGLDTIVGNNGVKLSGGQQQRICIARALIKNPSILLLDEATSALDSKSEKIIIESIDNLSKNITIIIIAHRFSTIMNSDKVVVIEGGSVVEEGTPLSLKRKQDGVFSNMLHNQKIKE